jgi:hypothetical protein
MEQRRIELELVRELRKPVEDMEISGKNRLFGYINIHFLVELCKCGEIRLSNSV